MNETANKFFLVRDKFMSQVHLWQSRFTYSACWPFTKYKERLQKFKETGHSGCTYQNELDKACSQHDIWLMEILNIYLEEQILTNYYLTKHLVLMDMIMDLHQWFKIFLMKSLLLRVHIDMLLTQEKEFTLKTINQLKNYTSQLLENI